MGNSVNTIETFLKTDIEAVDAFVESIESTISRPVRSS